MGSIKNLLIKDELNYPMFLDDLIEIQKYTIASWSYPKIGEHINIMFTKPSGHGGSVAMNVFNDKYNVPIIYWKQELSVIDIFSDIYPKFKSEKKKMLYIEDINRLLGKRGSVTKPLFSALLLIEQETGLTDIVSYGGQKMKLSPPLKMSVVTSITKDVLDYHYLEWYVIGLIDRIMLISWRITETQEDIILDYYDKNLSGKTKNQSPKTLIYAPKNIEISDLSILKPLRVEAKDITLSYFNKFKQIGFDYLNYSPDRVDTIREIASLSKPTKLRKYKELVLMSIGKAISEGRNKVEDYDVKEICKLSDKYFKLKYNFLNGGL